MDVEDAGTIYIGTKSAKSTIQPTENFLYINPGVSWTRPTPRPLIREYGLAGLGLNNDTARGHWP